MSQAPNRCDRSWNGSWVPLRSQGSNELRAGGISDSYFLYNGQIIIPSGANQPLEGQLYKKTYSIYHDHGQFYAVNYDATLFQVGTGDDGDGVEHPANRPANAEYMDWRCLGFHHRPQADGCCLSCATVVSEHDKLFGHLPGQRWPGMLFPEHYHANDRTQNGGLAGELPLILALVTFSVQPQFAQWALTSLFHNGVWGLHSYEDGRKIKDWKLLQTRSTADTSTGNAKRGMVVTVWCPLSSRAALEAYELGEYGCMFH